MEDVGGHFPEISATNHAHNVLILVLVEDVGGHWSTFNSRWRAKKGVLILVLVEDVGGHVVYNRLVDVYYDTCLNPCFGGRCGGTRLVCWRDDSRYLYVLILVLVEDVGGRSVSDAGTLGVEES